MIKIYNLLWVLIFFITIIFSCKEKEVLPSVASHSQNEGGKFKTTSDAMRVLWSDHACWTRNVIICLVDDAPGTEEAIKRLLQNQEDIGNAIKPYYGEEAGNALTTLLRNHITVAADLIIAAKNEKTDIYDTLNTAWYANGDSIAVLLNTVNPNYFPLAEMKIMMKDHLDYTIEEVVARVKANYPADVVAYDKVYEELMTMSDMIVSGIAKQFPDKF